MRPILSKHSPPLHRSIDVAVEGEGKRKREVEREGG